MDQQLEQLAVTLGEKLLAQHAQLVTAESCTGGYIAQMVTAIADSSKWFERGFVTYSNAAKHECLAVDNTLFEEYGAVSEQTALAMVEGALENSHGDYAVSVTGIAGPGGATADKPLGTVWFGFCRKNHLPYAKLQQFSGDRKCVRQQSVAYAFTQLIELIAAT